MPITYTLIRTKRKTLTLQINIHWDLIVRSPLKVSLKQIEEFIMKKINWIQKHKIQIQNKTPKKILSANEIKFHKKTLKEYIIPRVQLLWQWKNLPQITSIKITQSEWRWGSCSSKNWLCFSYRLAEFIDSPFIDAIIIHELAHLIEKNHQKPFWNLVYSWMPEYEKIIKNKY